MKIGLYFISTSKFDKSHDELVEEVLKAGVRFVQFREKDMSVREMYEIARKLRKLTFEYSAKLIVNDRVDLALAVDADGVHLGQDDFPYEVVRDIFDGIVGVSTHSVETALRAERFADYVSAGPVFKTTTKEDAKEPIGIEGLRRIVSAVRKPVVAIGGINRNNIEEVLKTGVKGIAIISAIAKADDPKREAEILLEIVKRYLDD